MTDVKETESAKPARNVSKDDLKNRLFFRLFQLSNQLERQSVQQIGITTVQWAVLGALSRESASQGIPFGDLSEYLAVTRQNLDGVLKRLERDDLVRRISSDSDKRRRLVQMTKRGTRYWISIQDRIYRFYDLSTRSLSFDDCVSLVHYINALNHGMKDIKSSDMLLGGDD